MTYWQQVAAAAHVMSSDGGSSGGGELCVELDGVDDRIDLDSTVVLPIDGNAVWSIHFRAQMLDDGGNMLLGTYGDNGNRIFFAGGASGNVRIHLHNDSFFDFLFDATEHQNEWLDGVFAFNGLSPSFVVNNVSYEYQARTWAGESTAFHVNNIGVPFSNAASAWRGYISDVAITLNGERVLEMPFNEGSGTTHYDTSPSGNNGTAVDTGAGYWVRV